MKEKIKTSDLNEDQKIKLINFIKAEQSNLRKEFLDLIQFISPELYDNLTSTLDKLTDSLTESISDDELKLNNAKTYDRVVTKKVQSSYSIFLSFIYNYDGKKVSP